MTASIALHKKRPIPKWKIEEVRRLKELLSKHEVIAIADIAGIGSSQIFEIRRKLQDMAVLRVSKNTLMKRAIDDIANLKPGIEKLKEFLTGQNIFIFTNINPFELSLFLERNKVAREARGGDIAPNDIVIPAGNTGFSPGPIISRFNQYKVPIRIEEGSVVVVKDTVVVKKGEVIPTDLADLLTRLNIKPIEVGLRVKALYYRGHILTTDDLLLNIDQYKEDLSRAYLDAVKLALGIAYPVKELIDVMLIDAHTKAIALAVSMVIPTKETITYIMARALAEANAIVNLIAPSHPELGFKVAEREAVSEEEPEKREEEEEKEEESTEEGLAEGLASLFG